MGKFIGGGDAGRRCLVTTGALQSKGTRLKLSDGKFTVTDGPFIEVKELMGGWAVIQAKLAGRGHRMVQALPQDRRRWRVGDCSGVWARGLQQLVIAFAHPSPMQSNSPESGIPGNRDA